MKIKAFLLITSLLPFFAAAQGNNFSLSGKIGSLNAPAKAYLDYMDNGVNHEDSTILVNGAFRFKGSISGIASARLALDHDGGGKQRAVYTGDVIYIYFGKEQIMITSNDSLENAYFSGSNVYNEFLAYNKKIGGTIMALTKAANADFNSGTPEQQRDSAYMKAVANRFRNNIKARETKQFEFAKANPDSYFGLVALSESAGSDINVAKAEPVYMALSKNLRETDMGKELAQRIAANSATAVGATAPLFTQNDVVGKPISLESLRGKVVLVEFWASWCGPCRSENPNLVKDYAQYKNKGFEILSVSLDNSKENWLKAIDADGLPWLHVSDLKGWNNAVGRLYGIRAVPANFLLGKDGKVIASNLRGEDLNKKLASIFNN
ncbi:AhpC/TSA family protein [Pedobacter chinensis]|uniref:AhpC/TSA family protein n=1 Tax=Pedobacter chinensis TaxID=2282421 RepID=A0A369PTM4_9SPHI|nr:TlpA disulfide reductase family protein [Pedobacter chinensis]RDC56011.1 AhpC/TSA family protein [Pedobacter chinensis]